MDLDRLQKSWNQIKLSSLATEDDIRNMISSKVKTTVDRLIRTETIFLLAIFPLIAVPFIVDWLLKGVYVLPFPIKAAYIFLCMISLFWQDYKRRLLKQIDMVNRSILDNRKLFLQYRLRIKYELIFGTIFVLIMYSAIVYSWKEIMTPYQFQVYCLVNLLLFAVIALTGVYMYRKIYYKQIRKIESAFYEIDILEKENHH
ncbi:MAG TPA: hypothetical protein DIT04_08645 [Dysgonomonas sp.]|nr:hypothetical protein [Dysgonomonas sp.]